MERAGVAPEADRVRDVAAPDPASAVANRRVTRAPAATRLLVSAELCRPLLAAAGLCRPLTYHWLLMVVARNQSTA